MRKKRYYWKCKSCDAEFGNQTDSRHKDNCLGINSRNYLIKIEIKKKINNAQKTHS